MQAVQEITSKQWQFSWDRRMTYQKIRLFSYGYQKGIPELFGTKLGSELYRVKDFNVSECYDRDEYTAAFSSIEKRFTDKDSIKLFKKLSKLIRYFEDDFKPAIEKMPISYASCDNKALLKAYQDYCQVEYAVSLPTWILFVPFEEIITRTLRLALEKQVGTEKAAAIIADISLPYRITPLDAHNQALYKIALAPEEKKGVLLSEMAAQFVHWGTYDVLFPISTRESFEKKVADLENVDVEKLSNEINEKYISHKQKTENIFKAWQGNEFIYELLKLYSDYANYKDWKNFYREQSSYKLKLLLSEIAFKINLPLECAAFLTEEETAKALNGEVAYSPDEIGKRLQDSAFVFLEGKLSIVTDPLILGQIDGILELLKRTEVEGTGAYPGVIRGPVRVIISMSDANKLQVGDILVTSTTRPDYVAMMQKSAGFVTNEGGLLSHAAIMARELKKPCVIGTKVATRILKDGDVVEIDGMKGTVKIIK